MNISVANHDCDVITSQESLEVELTVKMSLHPRSIRVLARLVSA